MGPLYYVAVLGSALSHVDSGPVAQWLELAAHNRLVGGSSPPGPTNNFNNLYLKCLLRLNRESNLATPLATSCRLRRRILLAILPAQQVGSLAKLAAIAAVGTGPAAPMSVLAAFSEVGKSPKDVRHLLSSTLDRIVVGYAAGGGADIVARLMDLESHVSAFGTKRTSLD
jgi:hypothetical protein